MRTFLAERVAARVAILAVVLGALSIIFMPPEAKLQAALWAGYGIGLCLPALVIGGVAGWLLYDKKVWLHTTLWVFIGTVILFLVGYLGK